MKFIYNMPTRIIMGEECLSENFKLFSSLGKKAIIVTGKKSAKENGSFADVHNVLEKLDIEYKLINNIEANPAFESVETAARQHRDYNADFVIGIGGGSPLDAAKAIAVLLKNDLDKEDLFALKFEEVLPVVAVPTTAGTGSEVTQYSIITDTINKRKRSIATEKIFPKYAFLDARYMKKLPVSITVNTAFDALSHAVEGYLSKRSVAVADFIAEESIRILGKVLTGLNIDDISSNDREELLYASMLAGQVIAHTGTTALHSIGYYLTVYKNIDHGKANALLFSEYLKFVNQAQAGKVDNVYKLMGLKGAGDFQQLIDKLVEKNEKVTGEELKEFAEFAMREKNITNTVPVPQSSDLESILKKSLL
jgi:alcohol dehydrogenase class IV